MPRKPRLHAPGGLYHVILRGNDRQAIFFDTDDRRRWESLIADGLDEHGHRIHAYCWMTNHVHMAIQCHERPLSGFMRLVASQYARSTNKKMQRTGHLFERRHRAILVQADSYLQELVRYIHLNPVRAGMVEAAADYQWCSHRAYLTGSPPDWLTLSWVLSAFGESPADAHRQYARFMRIDCPTSISQKFREGSDDDHRVLGDDGFIASLEHDVPKPAAQQTLAELAQVICQQHDVSAAELKSSSRERKYSAIRAEIGLAAIEKGIASNAEIARHFNRNQSGLSRAINRLRRQRK
jgi:REP element-mobilizing transposase RayT